MSDLIDRYLHVKQRIRSATELVGRSGCVNLLAVSKKHDVSQIENLAAAGQQHFGESYAQEGVDKINQLNSFPLTWHFIGPIQSNKAKLIAPNFDWVHSVDRFKVIKLLNDNRGHNQPPLNVLLQLKVGNELSKSGADYVDINILAAAVKESNHLELRGLMCIPPPSDNFKEQCKYFHEANQVYLELAQVYESVDTLSMGMSGDLEAAIQCGATLVRIGTDIFGVRPS